MPVSPARIILASGSSYRKMLLQKLQIPFRCESPDIDESRLPEESIKALVLRLAQQKAEAVARQHTGEPGLIIGSDQVALLGNQLLTKPGNHFNAVAQLTACSGQRVDFYTSLCLYNCQTGHFQLDYDIFSVYFRQLSAVQIENYLQADKPYDCAGSFKAEGLGITLFSKMQGDDPNSLIGLPLIKLTDMLIKERVL